jgi:microcystin degradation protein MlrC
MPRIAIAGLMHESNTFAGSRTVSDSFQIQTGKAIVDRWGAAHHEVGGFLEGAKCDGFEAVPTFMGWAVPAGPLTAAAYAELTDRLLAEIGAAGHVDAVLLALHGAMVAEGQSDADGATLSRVRSYLGPDVPLIVTLDYHANVSPLMAESCDALIAYRTYPHVDQRRCGLAAAALAARAARGEFRPTQALAKPRLLIPILAQETGRDPMKSILRSVGDEITRHMGVLSWSLLAGFPYADVEWAGPACLVVTDGQPKLARELAERLAETVWQSRHELDPSLPTVSEAVSQALAGDGLALLIDLGDNIGGGSAADSTVLIDELVRQGATGAIVVLYDPEAVQACVTAGVGNTAQIHAGGKADHHAPPLPVRGHVRLIHNGRYVEDEARHGGLRVNDQGLTAVVEMPGENLVVLTSNRHPPFSLGQLTSLGLRPDRARVIVVKAAIAYKAAYAPLGARVIEVDTPGLTAANPTRFSYQRLRRPILPLDPEPLVEAARR